jgi:hypothetical protein
VRLSVLLVRSLSKAHLRFVSYSRLFVVYFCDLSSVGVLNMCRVPGASRLSERRACGQFRGVEIR